MEFIAPESRKAVMKDLMEIGKGHDWKILRHVFCDIGKREENCIESIGKVITYEGRPADIISIRNITGQTNKENFPAKRHT